MKKTKYFLYTLMLFLACASNTHAACTQEEINEFKKVEDQYKITYKLDKTTKTYIVTFSRADTTKYKFSPTEKLPDMEYISNEKNSFTVRSSEAGEYTINIISADDNCDSILKTITLKLPEYNKYADDPLCKGIEEFVLCQPTYSKEIDYETFVSRINTYKKNHQNKIDEEEIEVEENKVLQYIEDNLVQIIIITIFLVLLIITTLITAKSIRKSRRLE